MYRHISEHAFAENIYFSLNPTKKKTPHFLNIHTLFCTLCVKPHFCLYPSVQTYRYTHAYIQIEEQNPISSVVAEINLILLSLIRNGSPQILTLIRYWAGEARGFGWNRQTRGAGVWHCSSSIMWLVYRERGTRKERESREREGTRWEGEAEQWVKDFGERRLKKTCKVEGGGWKRLGDREREGRRLKSIPSVAWWLIKAALE